MNIFVTSFNIFSQLYTSLGMEAWKDDNNLVKRFDNNLIKRFDHSE